MKKLNKSVMFFGLLIAILGTTSAAQACTFTFTNNSSDHVWITNKNLGLQVSKRQFQLNRTTKRLRINSGKVGKFGPNITHFFVYLSEGNRYILAREITTNRCGQPDENKLTIRDIFQPNSLRARQRGRFSIKEINRIQPKEWLFEPPHVHKFDI